jgi:hypothetical protein
MRKLSTRENVLLGGLLLAGLVYVYFATKQDTQTQGELTAGAAGARGAAAGEAPVVRMDLLARTIEDYDAAGRDLFKYAQRPPSAEEIRQMRAAAEAQRRADEAAAKAAAEAALREKELMEQRAKILALNPPPPPKPKPPQITFRYIGYLGPKENKNAVFEEGTETFLAARGEVVRGQFRVLEVKFDSVVIGYTRPEFKDDKHELRMVTK